MTRDEDKYFAFPRRDLLQGLGWIMLGAGVGPMAAFAEEEATAGDIYTPPGLQRDLPAIAEDFAPATFKVKPPFDLDDPVQHRYARLKAMMSLSGKTIYQASMSRHFLCPPDVPPVPLVNELDLITIRLMRAADSGPETARVFTKFTRVPIDPVSFEPIREIESPHLNRRIQLKDTLFASGQFELRMTPDEPPDLLLQSDKPYFRFGDDVGFINFDPRAGEGQHQPRMDTYIYRVNYDDLMDPRKDLVRADISYIALMRASVFRWTGIPEGDPTQVLSQKIGVKVHSLDEVPDQVRQGLVEKYPERA